MTADVVVVVGVVPVVVVGVVAGSVGAVVGVVAMPAAALDVAVGVVVLVGEVAEPGLADGEVVLVVVVTSGFVGEVVACAGTAGFWPVAEVAPAGGVSPAASVRWSPAPRWLAGTSSVLRMSEYCCIRAATAVRICAPVMPRRASRRNLSSWCRM